jgi:hypothetical protein
MATEVLDNLGRRGDATVQSGMALSTLAARWLNRAQNDLARMYDMLFYTSTTLTTSAVSSYVFPTGMRALYTLRVEDGLSSRKLECVMPWEMDSLVPKPNESTLRRPDIYTPYGTSFELYSIPNTVYTLRFRCSGWPTPLAADASTSDYHTFAIDADDVLVSLATTYGYRYLQEATDASEWQKRSNEMAQRIYIANRNRFPDWAPAGRGFVAGLSYRAGEYYNDPFIRVDP